MELLRYLRSHGPAERIGAGPADLGGESTCRSVLMVGTDQHGAGGVSSLIRAYTDAGLFERFPCTYIATHRRGGSLTKLRTAIRGWLAIFLALLRQDAPLLHLHVSSRASFWRKSVVCLMAQLAGRPYLLHLHGGEFLQFYQDECSTAAKAFIRYVFTRAARVIALSEQWRSALHGLCPRMRIIVLPNAVSLPDACELRTSERATTVLFLGDLTRAKGLFDLVRAIARVRGRFPGVELVCGGSGSSEPVRQLALEYGVADCVHCPGWLDDAAKRQALARAAIFALPSYAEGMPMALLEAMAWALPVVTCPVGGIPQVITHGKNGLLVKPGDTEALATALEELLEHESARAELGEQARSTIERGFLMENTLLQLGQIYRQFGIVPQAL